MTDAADAGPGPALHQAVDDLARALHVYVDVAAGVVAESGPGEAAALDPRLDDARHRAALVWGRLDDVMSEQLGLDAHIGMAWEPAASADVVVLPDADEVEDLDDGEDFFLHFVVRPAPGASPESLERALEVVDDAGFDVLQRLEEAGFGVPSFGASRGFPVDLDEDD